MEVRTGLDIVHGESIVPILKQTGELKPQAYFTWFPHLIPAVSVRQGDWELIRRFEPHPKYPETVELYNLKDDLGETRNLAGAIRTRMALSLSRNTPVIRMAETCLR